MLWKCIFTAWLLGCRSVLDKLFNLFVRRFEPSMIVELVVVVRCWRYPCGRLWWCPKCMRGCGAVTDTHSSTRYSSITMPGHWWLLNTVRDSIRDAPLLIYKNYWNSLSLMRKACQFIHQFLQTYSYDQLKKLIVLQHRSGLWSNMLVSNFQMPLTIAKQGPVAVTHKKQDNFD